MLLAGGLPLAAAAPLWGQGGAEHGLARVRRVIVEGEHALDEGEIKKVLKTQGRRRLAFWSSGAYFRQDFVSADLAIIRQFAAQRGFLQVEVGARTVEIGGGEIDVLYSLVEGARTHVRAVDLSPTTVLAREQLLEKLGTRAGEPFNEQRLAVDRQAIADAYADRGFFPLVTAHWAPADSASVRVAFGIVEGPQYRVGPLTIEGLASVDTGVVRRELLLRPGAGFLRGSLLKSAERLYETGLFQLVDFEPARVDTDSAVVELRVRVRERAHRWVEGGMGAGSLDGVRVAAQVGHGNLWGTGRRSDASTRYAFGRRKRFSNRLRYVEPWLFGSRLQGEAGVYFEQGDEAFKSADFSLRVWGLYLAARRRLSPFARATLGLDNQWSRAQTIPDLPDSALTNFNRGQLFTQRLNLLLQYDRLDDFLDPRKGEYYEVAALSAGRWLAGAGQFNKATVTGIWHRRVNREASLGLRLQVGGIWAFGGPGVSPLGRVPIQDLYRTGGASSVRGYPEDGIRGADATGGVLLLVSNAELRFPLVGPVQGAVFLDGGSVWSRPEDFKLRQLGLGGGPAGRNDYRWSAGAGLRVRTPVGPFRLDVGLRLRDELGPDGRIERESGVGTHLSIGQPF